MQTTKTETTELGSDAIARTDTRGSALVRTIDFHGLSRSMQERFAGCARGELAPHPLVTAKLRTRVGLLSGGAIAAAGVALALFLTHGFGDLQRGTAMHGLPTLPIYFVCVAVITLGLAQLWVLRMRRRALPFDRALYVFPLSLVDARDEVIRVFSLADVQSVDRDPDDLRVVRVVVATGEVFRFPASSEAAALESLRAVSDGRTEARALLGGAEDPRITWMFTLDPLQVPRISSPLGPRMGLGRRLPSWSDRAWIVAPIAGLLLAPPLRNARNHASDLILYRTAMARHDVESFRAYLTLGGRKSDEIRTVRLPRAELALARAAGTVEAIDAFRATHPGSAIEFEIMAARRTALLDELVRAKSVGTVAALQSFAKRWPDHKIELELRDAMHSLFVPAIEAYHKKPPASTEVRSFVDRLFAWSENKAHAGAIATTIRIRFRHRPSPSLRRADRLVSQHHWFIGEASYPSRYFDEARAVPREKAAGERLGKRVRDAFGATVFSVEQGDRLDDGDGALPEVTEPTLFITHGEDWRGPFDGSITKPRGVWVALTFNFRATFVIPGDTETLTFDFETDQPIPQQVIRANPAGGTSSAPLEDKIYGTMAETAFSKFEERYLATFLPAAS